LYDLAVIGGGVAGIFSALTAARHSAKAIIIDPNRIGGGATVRSAGVVTLQLDETNDVMLGQEEHRAHKGVLEGLVESYGFPAAWKARPAPRQHELDETGRRGFRIALSVGDRV
jgi:glycine/D-amino acid oxidase-like deaminating enzyme